MSSGQHEHEWTVMGEVPPDDGFAAALEPEHTASERELRGDGTELKEPSTVNVRREVVAMRGTRAGYALGYRLGITPWERYRKAAAASIAVVLDREEAERPRPPGRVLDLGCGRGAYTVELARRGWEAVGIDNVARAIDAANRRGAHGATFVVGDVTDLRSASLGRFDFFLDVGCVQGLSSAQRLATGRGVSALSNPRATVLLLAFQPTWAGSVVGGMSRPDVEHAFAAWEVLSVEPADTAGLGWPLTRTSPQWYRLRRQEIAA